MGILYQGMGKHVSDAGEFKAIAHPKVRVFATTAMSPWGYFHANHSRQDDNLRIGTHVGCPKFDVDEEKWGKVASKESLNNIEVQVRLNDRKYVNGLMDIQDGSPRPDMQNILRRSILVVELEIVNHASVHSQVAKVTKVQELWVLTESFLLSMALCQPLLFVFWESDRFATMLSLKQPRW